jgi:uncharacterized protein YqiB (DUF1249 family)
MKAQADSTLLLRLIRSQTYTDSLNVHETRASINHLSLSAIESRIHHYYDADLSAGSQALRISNIKFHTI